MGLRKRFRDFRDWCPQPPDRLPTKIKRYSMPIAAVFTVTLIFSVSFFVFSSSVMSHPSLPIVGTLDFGGAQNGTNVSGNLTSDTTWTQAGSPYTLVGSVIVNNGVTLTIQAGVTVNLQLNDLQVNGTLKAQGSNSNNVVFVAAQSDDRPYEGSITSDSSRCVIENAIINSTYIWSYNSVITDNDTFDGTTIQVMGGSAKISDNLLVNSELVCSYASSNGLSVISNNTIVGVGIGVFGGSVVISHNDMTGGGEFGISLGTATTIISDNTISSCGIYGSGGTYTIERNLIENNDIAIEMFAASPIIEKNTIINNSIGLNISNSTVYASTATITNNNIYNNSINNIYLGGLTANLQIPASQTTANNINAAYNWWGTTNTQAINQTIRDFKNDSYVGTVTFTPFLNTPNPQAVPDPNAPIPNLSPTPMLTELVAPVVAIALVVGIGLIVYFKKYRR
jgi:hypothetical protein